MGLQIATRKSGNVIVLDLVGRVIIGVSNDSLSAELRKLADIELLRQARRQGLPMLQKPYSPRDLARKVRETLDQRHLVTRK